MFFMNQNTELARARRAIWSLLPETYQEYLWGMSSCRSRAESDEKWSEFLQLICKDHEKTASRRNEYYDYRAPCPLCGGIGNMPYESGYKVGNGIYRHLTGSHNTGDCSVIDAIYWWYMESADTNFLEQETQENLLNRENLKIRRRSEAHYKVDPDDPPRLIDEGTGGKSPRSKEGLEWAEERLKSLGFSIKVDGNVKTYLWESDEVKVYADPRFDKNIEMKIFPKRKRKKSIYRYGRIVLQDRFRNKLVEQFEKLVQKNSPF